MANEMVERMWSKKDFICTIGLANRAVMALFNLKQKQVELTQGQQDFVTNCALDDMVHVIWRLTSRRKDYKTFKKEYLEEMEAKMKEELES